MFEEELSPELKSKLEYARTLRRQMRRKLRGALSHTEEIALCILLMGKNLTDDYNIDHLPIHKQNVNDALIRKLELLSGPNAYTMLKALTARESYDARSDKTGL